MNDRMPALYLGHGAPPLLDDPIWSGQLAAWAAELPRPNAILMVTAALGVRAGDRSPPPACRSSTTSVASTRSSTTGALRAPDATALAARVARRSGHRAGAPAHGARPRPRRLGAAQGDVPGGRRPGAAVRCPPRPRAPTARARRAAPAAARRGRAHHRSGFLTHGLRTSRSSARGRGAAAGPRTSTPGPPTRWPAATSRSSRGTSAPRPRHAVRPPDGRALHPALRDARGRHRPRRTPGIQVIDGFWMGLSKRSLQVA